MNTTGQRGSAGSSNLDGLEQQSIFQGTPEPAVAHEGAPRVPPQAAAKAAWLQMLLEKQAAQQARPPVPLHRRILNFLFKIVLHLCLFVAALVALVAYEHFKLNGSPNWAFACLIAAIVFGLIPLHDIMGLLFAIKRTVLRFAFAFSGFIIISLFTGGVLNGGPIMKQVALLPSHAVETVALQLKPGSREAFRSFAGLLPEVMVLSNPTAMTSPQDVRKVAATLSQLMHKAQEVAGSELGQGEDRGGVAKMVIRASLALGLDTIDHALGQMAENPSAAKLMPGLRAQLARARESLRGAD